MLLGEKGKFAIEFEITKKYCWKGSKYIVGKTQLFLNNKRLGNWDDENLLGVLLTQLKGILKLEDNKGTKFKELTYDQIREDFENRENYSELGLIQKHLAENFDDYYIFLFKQNGLIAFIWRYVDKPHHRYSDYNIDIFIESIGLNYFEKVVIEFDKEFHLEESKIPPC